MSSVRVAVDIGGTFTDIVVLDSVDGTTRVEKVLSTPDDLSRGIFDGLQQALPAKASIDFFVHGTTAGLNAFLERKGAHAALVTTSGFRDVYEIARANRPDMYNLFYRKPTPLIRRRHIYELNERMLYNGDVLTAIDDKHLLQLVEKIAEGDYESIAVCLLHSYVNPEHELRVGEVIREQLPGVSVSLSHQVAREWREYERTSTTVLNAYVAPIVQTYLSQLEEKAQSSGMQSGVHIMQSNGGIMTSVAARERPVQTLFSGPVGGTMGGMSLQDQLDRDHLLCVDMGGTSFDVSLIVGGRADLTLETELEGFTVLAPVVNINTIGAGGGSVAWLEAGGLRVGPQSAGARPGPACYGNGGMEPTVTDANLVLGRLPETFLSGEMGLDVDAARSSLVELSKSLGLSSEALAEGIIDIVNAKMANAIRALTVERGIDPRQFAVVAYGGAGPVHAVFLAKELDIPTVVVPYAPGTFSAWGMLHTDIKHDFVRSFFYKVAETSAEEVEGVLSDLMGEGSDTLRGEGVIDENMLFRRTADIRYVGQEYFLNIDLPDMVDETFFTELPEKFHDAYLTRYGHSNPDESIEFVNLRVGAVGQLPHHTKDSAATPQSSVASPQANRQVIFEGDVVESGVYNRSELRPGDTFEGPAIVEEASCTTVIPPLYEASVDAYGNIVIRVGSDQT